MSVGFGVGDYDSKFQHGKTRRDYLGRKMLKL